MKSFFCQAVTLLSILAAGVSYASSNPARRPVPSSDPSVDKSLPEISGIRGGVSTESAVKQVQSNVEDWTDERNQMTPLQKKECEEAKVIGVFFPNGIVPSPPIQTSSELPEYFTTMDSGRSAIADDAENLQNLGSQAFAGVPLLAAERQQLQVIQNHPLDTLLDRYDALIDLQQLSMTVANRIFSYDIETYHLSAAVSDYYGKLGGVENRCKEYTLRIQRDNEMTLAAQELIDLYADYGTESTRELANAVNQETQSPTPPN